MKIITRDGRVFQGTPLQIVQAMKAIAFGVEGMTIDEYIDWVVGNTRRFEGVELKLSGGTTDERARSLVELMIAKALVR